MNPQLILEVKDYRNDTAWRWVLSDAEGRRFEGVGTRCFRIWIC